MKINKEKLIKSLKFIEAVILPVLGLAINSTLKYLEN